MTEPTQQCAARVLLVDDHPAVRHGVGQLLIAGGHAVAGEAESRQEALARLGAGAVDLALLDLSLEESSGFDLLADLDERDIPVLVYSMHEDPDTIERALRWGALGYVTKREKPRVLLEAVREVMAGHRFLSPRSARKLADGACVSPQSVAERGLSERENQILLRLSRGDTRQEIADALGISIRTVETYFGRLITKLELSNMKGLRKYAISHRPAP